MALGPKELGSWAIDSILSTPNSGGYRGGCLVHGTFAGPRNGAEGVRKEYEEYKEFKDKRRRACEQPSGIAWYQKDSKSYHKQNPS
jgi:hypothetical protein